MSEKFFCVDCNNVEWGVFTFVLTNRRYLTYYDVWQYHKIADYRQVMIRNLRVYFIETEGSEHNKMENLVLFDWRDTKRIRSFLILLA